ncbi:MAG TPA: ApaLI family restriction endonuclease [Thermoanaerobaculia bacterium]|jgi:hypothetical protein
MDVSVEEQIRALAITYGQQLREKIDARSSEMEADDTSHYLVYRVLGISLDEGRLIDLYQNKGRFLYKYAGSFLENAAKLCLKSRFPDSGSQRIHNTIGRSPKTFEIDCVVGADAIEIKWRDATTDGDHITKEHTRIKTIASACYNPVRVMFYYPNRDQAKRIQAALETLYKGVGGEYHFGDGAWRYIEEKTGVRLHALLETLAHENEVR